MTVHSRWGLAAAMACGLVMACSSSGGVNPPPGPGPDADTDATSMDDASMQGDSTTPGDRGADATGDRAGDAAGDRGADATGDRGGGGDATTGSACSMTTDISMRMPGADGAIHVTGNNESGAPMTLGAIPMSCINAMEGTKGMVVVYEYRMRAAGLLRVSTVNTGTMDAMFDTIVAVLSSCSATAMSLACNDDAAGAAAPHRLHSTATSGMLMAGQRVFIVVGGYGADPAKASTGDFELTVQEVNPGGLNSPCRTTAPFCDMDLTCSAAMPTAAMPGTCRRTVAVGMPCTATDICAMGAACIANPGSTTMGTCRADGTAGGRCRTTGTACDMGLACTARMPTTAAPGFCRTSVAAGAECDATQVMNACAAGTSCRPAPTAMNLSRTVCAADGARGGLCRADSPRCDMGLDCSSGTPATCRAAAAMGGECDLTGTGTFCPTGSSCAPNAMLNGGTCQANGTAAGTPCRDMDPRCGTGLTCSAMTGAGTCQRSVPAGMGCDLRFRSTTCATGSICLGAAGAATGTCTAATMETEPNNMPAMGNGPVTATTVFRGGIMPTTDVDCFRVTVPMGGSITAFTSDASGTGCALGMGADTILTLNNPAGTMIATNDDATGRGLCSEINPTTAMATASLAAGTYSLCVSAFQPMMGMGAVIPDYYLTVRVNPAP